MRCGKQFRTHSKSSTQYCSDECRFPQNRGAKNGGDGKNREKSEHVKSMEPIRRGAHQTGIIPKTAGWNSQIPTKDKSKKPKARIKTGVKLPYRGEPTRAYRGPDPSLIALESLYKHQQRVNAKKEKNT